MRRVISPSKEYRALVLALLMPLPLILLHGVFQFQVHRLAPLVRVMAFMEVLLLGWSVPPILQTDMFHMWVFLLWPVGPVMRFAL